jgi:hypothetical protein
LEPVEDWLPVPLTVTVPVLPALIWAADST